MNNERWQSVSKQELNYGLSGCELTYLGQGRIRKLATDAEYSERLMRQAEKQLRFKQKTGLKLQTPLIYDIGRTELSYFDMEYIPGADFNSFFQTAGIKEIENFLKIIFEFLDAQLKNSTESNLNHYILQIIFSVDQSVVYNHL